LASKSTDGQQTQYQNCKAVVERIGRLFSSSTKMVKLTNALVARKMTKKSGPLTVNDTDALKKLTHLHLQGSFIDTIVSTPIY